MNGEDMDLADLMGGMDEEAMEKELEKMMFGEGAEESEDQEDLTEQEMKILEFGQKNITRKRGTLHINLVGNKKKKK